MYYVYVLKSKIKPWKYIGSTDDIERRLLQHNSGRSKATKPYRPFELLHLERYDSRSEAVRRENFFKTGVGREELQKILGM